MLKRPAGYAAGERPPLLVVLHGTDDTAQDMIDFWSARKARLPLLMAAPQGIGQGWRDEDVPAIRAMMADLRARFSFDESRVLLAGFSAGGAMTFHLLYTEKLPLTAAAALANYVPPRITDEQIHDRRDVPVFYAVGMTDVNQDLMREGIERLRLAGADVELYRPRIGHRLDPAVAQAAVDWLFDRCSRQVSAAIEKAAEGTNGAGACRKLENIVDQARWHEPAHVTAATEKLERVEADGRRKLADANRLIAEGKALDAFDTLVAVETNYGDARLGRQARSIRERLQADPAVQHLQVERKARQRAEEAMRLYAGAQRLVSDRKLREAAARCRQIIDNYGETPVAQRAEYLLKALQPAISP